jgi:hypothetical protein
MAPEPMPQAEMTPPSMAETPTTQPPMEGSQSGSSETGQSSN